jgi:hypothetical protein
MSVLDAERATATFNPVNLTYFLDGGKENTVRRQYLRSLVEQEPLFDKRKDCFLGRTERWGLAMQRLHKTHELIKQYKLSESDAATFKGIADEIHPTSVHDSMFCDILASYFIPNLT